MTPIRAVVSLTAEDISESRGIWLTLQSKHTVEPQTQIFTKKLEVASWESKCGALMSNTRSPPLETVREDGGQVQLASAYLGSTSKF